MEKATEATLPLSPVDSTEATTEQNLSPLHSNGEIQTDDSLLYPLSEETTEENTLRREMKFRHAFSFVVGCMVGAGIFVTPSLIAQRTPNLFVSLLAWIVAGLMALIGGLCYCEMSSIVKKTGSSYVFILDCYGPAAGFLVNWANVFLFAPCDACILLLTIGLYACAPFYEDHTSTEYQWMSKFVGIAIMLCISLIHCLGAKKSGIFQMVFMAIQMLVFATIICLGVYSLSARNTIHHFSPNVVFNNTMSGLSDHFPSFGIALFNALYCFDGYVTIAFIVEEVINPSKAVPLLSFTSIPFVTFLYILINLACACVLTHQEVAASNVFLSDIAFKIGGSSLSYVVPFAVAICVVPALSAVFYNLPRLMMSAAREGQFPRFFALIHKERRTPIPSVIYLAIVSTVLTLLNLELQSMLQICNIVIWIEYAFAISTILVNRWRKPNMKRGYKTWLITPIIMIVIPLILLILAIIEKSFITILILILMMLGLPVYFVCLKKRWISTKINKFVYKMLVSHTALVECKINREE